eukprot:jgi/Hompol1/7016/HPOL_005157-RA
MRGWTTLLPYSAVAQTQADEWLSEIKHELAHCVRAGNLGAGATWAVRSLQEYLSLRLPLSLGDRCWITRLLFKLATLNDLDPSRIEIYAAAAALLIKFLDWKPFNDLLHSMFLHKKSASTQPSDSRVQNTVIKLGSLANRYFSTDSTAQILDIYLPLIDVNDLRSIVTYLSLLTLLLPVHAPPAPPVSPLPATAMATDAPWQASFYWVPTMFSIWTMIANVPSFDTLFMDLFARLSSEQIATPDNTPWTDLQIRIIFAIGMKNLELPVGSGASGLERMPIRRNDPTALNSTSGDKGIELMDGMKKSKVDGFAKFIVYTIFEPASSAPDRIRTKSLEYLETLIQATESFFHPSNSGKWSYPVARFVQSLAQHFLARTILEDKVDSNIPEHYRTTKQLRRRFVELLRSVAFLAMFGKDQSAISASHSALKSLAWIDPDAIIPGLLDRAFPALESLTETHRTMSCIFAIFSSSAPMISSSHYPSGGRHLSALLQLTLPGLDMNDIPKSTATLLFIANAVRNTPLIDSSSYGASNSNGMDIDDTDLSEAVEARRASTAEFESWLVQYLDRIFAIFENLPQNYGIDKSHSTPESGLVDLLLLSDGLETIYLRKLAEFCRGSVVPAATKAIGTLCGSIAHASPKKRLAVFVPMCCSRILEEIDTGAASKPSSKLSANANPFGFESMSDASLHWFQSILNGCIRSSGDAVLQFRADIEAVLDKSINCCVSRRGYKWANKLLRRVTESLLCIEPTEMRSHSPTVWNSADFQHNSHMHWSEMVDIDQMDLQWYVPSQEAIDFAEYLLEKYIALARSKIMEFIANPVQYGASLPKWMSLLKNCICGKSMLLKIQPSMTHNNESDDLRLYSYHGKRHPMYSGEIYADPSSPKFQYWTEQETVITTLLHEAFITVNQHRADDVEATHAIISCIQTLITYHGVPSNEYESGHRMYKYVKASYKLSPDQTAFPRMLQVQRAHLTHLGRLKHACSQRPCTDGLRLLIHDLAEASLSLYTVVRKQAQSALGSALNRMPAVRIQIFPVIMRIIEDAAAGKNVEPERIKGALYVMRSSMFLGLVISHWRYTNAFLSILVRAQHEDKPTVLELIHKTYVDFLKNFTSVSLTPVKPSSDLFAMTDGLVLDQTRISTLAELEQHKFASAAVHYNDLIHSLVNFANDNTAHWRFAAMAANLLDTLIRNDQPITSQLMLFTISNTINEHPILRKHCMSLLMRILVIIKERATKHGTSVALTAKRTVAVSEYLRTSSPFAIDTLPVSSRDLLLNDNLSAGWLVWPREIKLYSFVHSNQGIVDQTSAEAHAVLESQLINADILKALVHFAAQETSRSIEAFSRSTAATFKRISAAVGHSLLAELISLISPLVARVDDKSAQRASAEILAGLVRGSKHWPVEHLDSLWHHVTPLFSQALDTATTETIGIWIDCVRFICVGRDPHRVRPLIKLIVEARLNPLSSSFFPETKKLYFVKTLISIYGSVLANLWQPLFATYIDAVSNPYEQIRNTLGTLINDLLQLQWHPTLQDTPSLIHSNIVYWASDMSTSAEPVAIPTSPAPMRLTPHSISAQAQLTNELLITQSSILDLLRNRMPIWRTEP